MTARVEYKLYGELVVFSGTANRPLAEEVAAYLGLPLGEADVFQFPNTNTFVRLRQSVRGKDVFVIQPTASPTNDNLMELLIFMDALRRDSAGRITAVVPYYGYGRTDKKDQPRVPITARLVADLITVAGADRFLTVDLHAGQIQGFFTIPTDELTALHLLGDYFAEKAIPDAVVVAPDVGATRRARDFARRLNLPLAVIEKRRPLDGSGAEILTLIGDVEGKNAIVVDDEVDTAATLTRGTRFLLQEGAREVYACATHAILSGTAIEDLQSSGLKQLVVTNTAPVAPPKRRALGSLLTVLSVGKLLGEVIRRIHGGISVGEMFDE
ncbi:MAG: ribose-phosphate pyrophosphokinase [Anaerolineae bacterium]|nr:ribose-phosphate pyrophosphokinase [Anaerolineae bacterium]